MSDRYPINDCYPTIQGEGTKTGIPMVLLRLHGCDVGCPWCDTKETWEFQTSNVVTSLTDALGSNGRFAWLSANQVVDYLNQKFDHLQWIMITGGEPAQYNLAPLVEELHTAGYKVALETSGTEVGHLTANCDWVTVSPKIDMPGGKTIKPAALRSADEIKHVVGSRRDIVILNTLLESADIRPNTTICLQPLSTSERATELCVQTVLQRGWRLSIQTHKLIGQP